MPAHRHARKEQQETSRRHRINDKQGQAGRLGRNLANDTSGRQHEQRQRQRSNAATSFSTIDGAQDRLNTLADRMARMREARKALTKLCTESTKSMPPTAGQARNICTKPTTQDTETLKQAYATQPRPTETSTGETRLGEAKHANKGQRRRQAQLAHTAPTAQSGTKPASSAAQTKAQRQHKETQHAQDSCVSLFGSGKQHHALALGTATQATHAKAKGNKKRGKSDTRTGSRPAPNNNEAGAKQKTANKAQEASATTTPAIALRPPHAHTHAPAQAQASTPAQE
ncbi:hypothetical protein ERJ75_001697700 [Trypanosoma vivax]|nr:hypothetical protein ERJ75_001697700 [Trypanosoma vivax]